MRYLFFLISLCLGLNAQTSFSFVYQNDFLSESVHSLQKTDTSWLILNNTSEQNGSYFIYELDTHKNILNQKRYSSSFYYNGINIYRFQDSVFVVGNTNINGGNQVFIHSYNLNLVFQTEKIFNTPSISILKNGYQNGNHFVLVGSYLDSLKKSFILHYDLSQKKVSINYPNFTNRQFEFNAIKYDNDSIYAGGYIISNNFDSENLFVVKLDTNFNVDWTYEEDSVLNEAITCMDTFPNQQMLFGGYYYENGNDSKNVLGIKLNRKGIFQNRIKYSNPKDEIVKNIYTNYEGNILFMIETYKDNVWLTDGEIGSNAFLLKTNSDGMYLSSTVFGNIRPDYLNHTLINHDNSLFLCMSTESFGFEAYQPYVIKTTPNETWEYIVPPVVGLNEINWVKNIFPNPTKDYWRLTFNEVSEYEINLIDINGNVVLRDVCHGNQYFIEAFHLSSGIYFLQLKNKEQMSYTYKLQKY